MNSDFMKENRFRKYFNLQEILEQANEMYDYNLVKEYKDICNLKTAESEKYLKQLKFYCDTKKKLVKKILSIFNIKLDKYKVGKNYEIPILLAELIYVIATEESSDGSVLSKLNTNKENLLKYEEHIKFKEKLLEQVKQDYPEFSEDCDEILIQHHYLLNVYNQIDDILKKFKDNTGTIIKDLEEDILKKMYAPFIPFDYELEKVVDFMDNVFSSDTKDDALHQLSLDIKVLSISNDRIYDLNEFEDKISAVKKAQEELNEQLLVFQKTVNELKESMFLIL